MRQRPGMTLDQPTHGNRDVDWRRFCSRGLLDTSTTPCVPFSVLEFAINKQGQLWTVHVQARYVKRPTEKTGMLEPGLWVNIGGIG